jgi:hypothetical protein
MNELLVSSTIVLFEVTSALVVCGAIAFTLHVRGRHRDRDALERLTTKVKGNRTARVERAKQFLKEKLHFPDDQIDPTANTLINVENGLYKSLLTLYAQRDSSALVDIDTRVQQVIDAYCTLLNATGGPQTIDPDGQSQTAQTIADLETKNAALEQELAQIKSEMNATVNEYASAFGGGHEGATHVLEGEGEESAAQPAPPKPPSGSAEKPKAKIADPSPAAKVAATGKKAANTPAMPTAPAKGDGDDIDSILASLNIESFDLGSDDELAAGSGG